MNEHERARFLLRFLQLLLHKGRHPPDGAVFIPSITLPSKVLHRYSLVLRQLSILEMKGIVDPIYEKVEGFKKELLIGWRIKNVKLADTVITEDSILDEF